MAFKNRIKELMSSHLEAELMEGLKHDRYMRAHGKKASGTATWMFTTKKDGEVNYDNDKEVFQSGPSMKLGDAAKEAMKALGKTIYVMEAKLDPVGQEDDDVDNDGDVDSSDKYLKKRRAAIKKAIGTKPKLREQAKKQKAKMMPVKGSVDDANDTAQKATGGSVKEDDATARMYKDNPEMMNQKGPGGMKSLTKSAQRVIKKKMNKMDEGNDSYYAMLKAKEHAKRDGANYDGDVSVQHKYDAYHMKKRGFTHYTPGRFGTRTYHKSAAAGATKIGPEHHRGVSESVELVEYSEGAMVKDMVKLNASSCGKTEMYEKMKEKYGVDKATFEGLYASHCMSTNEEVELEEGTMMSAAKELEAYARKNGGIDKNDFMKAVVMMKKGQKPQLMKFVDGLDTEPRDKILDVLDKHLKEDVDAETVMMENLAEAIENTDLSKLTLEELKEIEEGIIKALGVAGAKTVGGIAKGVGAVAKGIGRAAKATVINKQGNIRGTAAARDDAKANKINKTADKMQKRQDAADRLKAAQARVDAFTKKSTPAKKPLTASYAEGFETPSNEKKLADLGRKMMDMGKAEKNDTLANAYARLGDALTRYGTTFGARNMKELEKKTGMKPAIIADLMKRAVRHK